jgi:Na+/H+ antiporter NhaD/arsenite permease-like protein
VTLPVIFSAAFILVYVYIAVASRHRGIVVWAGAAAAVTVSLLAGFSVDLPLLFGMVSWNVLLIFSGILFTAEVLIDVGIPAHLAGKIISVSKNYGWAALLICGLASVISMFVENVATVMIVAPIALEVSRKHREHKESKEHKEPEEHKELKKHKKHKPLAYPVVLLIGIAIASNLQGTSTLVGDPPSMILAASENMGFNDFFFMNGKPGIFWAVQCGAVSSFFVLYYLMGRDRSAVPKVAVPPVASWVPAWILAGMIAGLALVSFLSPGINLTAGLLCISGGLASLLWYDWFRKKHGYKWENCVNRKTRHVIKAFDIDTLLLLAGIFFMVAALDHYGVMASMGSFLAKLSGNDPLNAYIIIVAGSLLFSAFVDNVPFVTAMIPVTHALATSIGGEQGSHLYLSFGLLIGSCLGGNISPVGASANIVAVSLLRKSGFKVSFWQFVRVGLPFTLAAIAFGASFIWFVWHP